METFTHLPKERKNKNIPSATNRMKEMNYIYIYISKGKTLEERAENVNDKTNFVLASDVRRIFQDADEKKKTKI